MPKARQNPETFQAIVAAPGFCLGIRCDDAQIHRIDFLAAGAETSPSNPLAMKAAQQLQAFLSDAEFTFNLPLRPSGTAFQRRVWSQIAAIPNHQTRTYGELAQALNNAPRAVGQACGANPFPIVVPCHRVVATKGGLGGFAHQRGGFLLEVKRWLLAHEGH
ncbi:methylated-DNA--[protein]-cysteine S-methyltransferase [Propionivibrio sp.]|uniref:methylated-DNA--[protein]-cysteine S-methyltransferase n=1 Tax=Propionivibrio sp. TaxID=2212460 RepID=UPI0025D7C826|nr:methylated-DNA--[protein]-cysteine S-methyltransferase [Propionivibrio sp.]